MKNLLMIVSIAFLGLNSCSKKNEETTPVVSAQEQSDLVFLREEEKLAHDVYAYAFKKYGNQSFSNIANSEQNHTTSVLSLLTSRNIPDPSLNMKEGEFKNIELQSIYNNLISIVDSSETHAIKVGATIEDLDINDIHHFYTHTSNPEILLVYDKLTCGSRNHMRSFSRQLTGLSLTYTPQYISTSEYESIITGENEPCGLVNTGKK